MSTENSNKRTGFMSETRANGIVEILKTRMSQTIKEHRPMDRWAWMEWIEWIESHFEETKDKMMAVNIVTEMAKDLQMAHMNEQIEQMKNVLANVAMGRGTLRAVVIGDDGLPIEIDEPPQPGDLEKDEKEDKWSISSYL